jgi:hypothetical protein
VLSERYDLSIKCSFYTLTERNPSQPLSVPLRTIARVISLLKNAHFIENKELTAQLIKFTFLL